MNTMIHLKNLAQVAQSSLNNLIATVSFEVQSQLQINLWKIENEKI